jgi:uncharacterized protein YkwD
MIRPIWQRLLALIVPVIVANAGLTMAAPTATAMDTKASASQALALVNQKRVKAGCATLPIVPKLQTPAERQSRDQAARNKLGHTGADGSTPRSRLGGLGYSRWAENIAQFQSAQAAVKFWSTSAGHRANMLNCAFTDTGLSAIRSASGKLYWTQTFGG